MTWRDHECLAEFLHEELVRCSVGQDFIERVAGRLREQDPAFNVDRFLNRAINGWSGP